MLSETYAAISVSIVSSDGTVVFIHEVAAFIALSHEEDPEYYCVSCVTEMAQERDLYVYIYPSVGNEHITTIMIYENRTGIGNPYTFVFFNKYTGEEQTPKLQSV